MKNINSFGKILVLMVVMSGTVLAQRTSSVIQTVTFGVHRSSLLILHNLSLAQGAVQSPDGSRASTLQNAVSTYPMKVTIQAPSLPAANDKSMAVEQSSPRLSRPTALGSGSVPGTSDIQLDTRSPYGGTSLVVTFTE
jgi:hypothetical protein